MSKLAIVAINPGHDIPEDVLVRVIADNPGPWGMAWAADGDLNILPSHSAATLEDVQALLADTTDNSVLLAFHSETEVADEDIQPFALLFDPNESEAKEVIAMAATGNFSRYHIEKSGHSDYFHFRNQTAAGLQRILRIAKGDVDVVMSEMKEADSTKDLHSRFDDGMLAFLACTGEIMDLSTDAVRKPFDWGFMSAIEGEYPEKEAEPEAPVLDLKAQKLAELKAKKLAEKGGTAPGGTAAHGKVAPTEPLKQTKIEGDAPVVYETRTFLIPTSAGGKAAKKMLKDRGVNINGLRGDWYDFYVRQQNPVPFKVKVEAKKAQAVADINKAIQGTEPKADTTAGSFQKDTGTHHLSKTNDLKEGGKPHIPEADDTVLLSAETVRKINESWLKSAPVVKHIDASSKEIKKPSSLNNDQPKRISFASQVGLPGNDMHYTLNWGPELLFQLSQIDPKALVNLLMDYRTAYSGFLKKAEDAPMSEKDKKLAELKARQANKQAA